MSVQQAAIVVFHPKLYIKSDSTGICFTVNLPHGDTARRGGLFPADAVELSARANKEPFTDSVTAVMTSIGMTSHLERANDWHFMAPDEIREFDRVTFESVTFPKPIEEDIPY